MDVQRISPIKIKNADTLAVTDPIQMEEGRLLLSFPLLIWLLALSVAVGESVEVGESDICEGLMILMKVLLDVENVDIITGVCVPSLVGLDDVSILEETADPLVVGVDISGCVGLLFEDCVGAVSGGVDIGGYKLEKAETWPGEGTNIVNVADWEVQPA